MTDPTHRPYAGAADLRRMQQALADAYDRTHVRVGDVAWRARHHTHRELALEIQLWGDGDRLVGWTWFRTNGGFDLMVLPGCRAAEPLLDAMLDVVDDAVARAVAAGDPLDSVYTFFATDDDQLATAVGARGYVPVEAPGGDVLMRDLDDVAVPSVPAGYRLSAVETDGDVLGRVTANLAAFERSDLSVVKYHRVRRTWPYRADLDRIVVTDDGAVVAFCTAWLDEQNRAGLLEPVGTHPEHQRRGLATAVSLDALRVLRAAGARTVQVGTGSDAAVATYRGIGFRPWKREVVYRKAVDPTSSLAW